MRAATWGLTVGLGAATLLAGTRAWQGQGGAGSDGPAPGTADVPTHTLKDLEFLVGDWRGEREGSTIEECWRGAIGDNMAGLFRSVGEDGEVELYELMVIEQEAAGPVLRLKHFSKGLRGWEERHEAAPWKLASFDGEKAVFEKAEGEKTESLTYWIDGKGLLRVKLDAWRGEEPLRMDFEFHRF